MNLLRIPRSDVPAATTCGGDVNEAASLPTRDAESCRAPTQWGNRSAEWGCETRAPQTHTRFPEAAFGAAMLQQRSRR